MAPNLIGKIIANRYRVDAFLAAGGMGAVYRVYDLQRNIVLAMKVLDPEFILPLCIYINITWKLLDTKREIFLIVNL